MLFQNLVTKSDEVFGILYSSESVVAQKILILNNRSGTRYQTQSN